MVKIKISTTCSASTNYKHFGHAQSKGTNVKRGSGTDEKMHGERALQSSARQVMRPAQQETSDRYLKWRRRSSLRTVIMHSMKNAQESMNMQSMKITKENMIMQSMRTMKASKKDGAAMPCGPLLVQIEPKASNAL